jgi:hypothetical protein
VVDREPEVFADCDFPITSESAQIGVTGAMLERAAVPDDFGFDLFGEVAATTPADGGRNP